MFDDNHLPSKVQVILFVCVVLPQKVIVVLFDWFFHIIHAAVAHFYVIFVEYLMVAMFVEMFFNQF